MMLYLLIRQQMKKKGLSERKLAEKLKMSELKLHNLLTDLVKGKKYAMLESVMLGLDCFGLTKYKGENVASMINNELKSLYKNKEKSDFEKELDEYSNV